jgi:hypothetical protein
MVSQDVIPSAAALSASRGISLCRAHGRASQLGYLASCFLILTSDSWLLSSDSSPYHILRRPRTLPRPVVVFA